MKTQGTPKRISTLLLALAFSAVGATSARADMWDYCARLSTAPGGVNTVNFTDTTTGWGNSSATSAISTTASRVGNRYYGASSGADSTVGFTIQCTGDTAFPAATTWRLWYCVPATSRSPNLVASVTASAGTHLDSHLPLVGGLPTVPYTADPGTPVYAWAQAWAAGDSGFQCNKTSKGSILCYFTNDASVVNPAITFRYVSGTISGSSRWYADLFRFENLACCNPCVTVPAVSVPGPLYAGQTNLTVTGVSVSATAITIYADGVPFYTNIVGIIVGANTVTMPPLPLGKRISATQTIGGIEGCVCACGTLVREWPAPTTISNLAGTALRYGGGVGAQFVLLGTNDLTAPPANWPRLATNPATPGTFNVPPPGSASPKFYRIQSE
jgi:hypothetical protein